MLLTTPSLPLPSSSYFWMLLFWTKLLHVDFSFDLYSAREGITVTFDFHRLLGFDSGTNYCLPTPCPPPNSAGLCQAAAGHMVTRDPDRKAPARECPGFPPPPYLSTYPRWNLPGTSALHHQARWSCPQDALPAVWVQQREDSPFRGFGMGPWNPHIPLLLQEQHGQGRVGSRGVTWELGGVVRWQRPAPQSLLVLIIIFNLVS